MPKVILLDSSVFAHKAIFSWSAQETKRIESGKSRDDYVVLPSAYNYFQMIIGALKRVGVDKEDIIIVAKDGYNSWRKAFLKAYKAQRKGMRDKYELIDWKYHYGQINKINKQLEDSTNWHFLQFHKVFNYADLLFTEEGKKYLIENDDTNYDEYFGLEADDIIAVAPKVFKDKECVIVSIDADLQQLIAFGNVKFFSLAVKYKGGSGCYKIVQNGYKILEEKLRKGDKSDNIIAYPDDTDKDFEIRNLVVNLIDLPNFVIKPIKNVLENLQPKELKLNKLPYQKSLAKRFKQIYLKDKIITYEDAIKREERKRNKKKRKKK